MSDLREINDLIGKREDVNISHSVPENYFTEIKVSKDK